MTPFWSSHTTENRVKGNSILLRKTDYLIDYPVLLLTFLFLLSYFETEYLFLKTITTGGDTASHFYTAHYLKEYLLPNGKIIGWTQGNYAGFPLFQFYFPLPFILAVLLGYLIPLTISFKLTSVLGIFLLPVAAYYCFRKMRFEFPIPVFGAVGTLPFLFIEANSMWGGNILSTLAGEITYSLGFAFSFFFIGSLYDGLTKQRHVVRNAVLIALTGLCHGYTLLFAGLASLFFLITTENFIKKFFYLARVHTLGFCLMGFWILPLLWNLPNTTRYNFVWVIQSISEVFPPILIPFIAIALLGRAADTGMFFFKIGFRGKDSGRGKVQPPGVWDARILYLWFCVLVGGVFYLIAYRVNVVDIRFLPFLQIFLVLIGAVELGRFIKKVKGKALVPYILLIFTVLWVDHHSVQVRDWIVWNYSGFEKKHAWPIFQSINHYLSGSESDPRVVYEHSPSHNSMGTLRAFESLPFFSGRSTLEGIYMQSSISSPFVFYIQSEISKERSCPLPDYGCSSLNLKNGIRHLKMFNVRDFIVLTPEVKAEIKKFPEWALKKKFGQYEVYELTTNENRYVSPLRYEPVLFESDRWKLASYRWFKNPQLNDVHLVFAEGITEEDRGRFETVAKDPVMEGIKKVAVEHPCTVFSETVREEVVVFQSDCLDQPVLVKISYHPNWKVTGARKVYLASPSFMLVFPEKKEVRLAFSRTWVEYSGMGLTTFSGLIVLGGLPFFRKTTVCRSAVDGAEGMARYIRSRFMELPATGRLYGLVDRHRLAVLITVLITVGVGLTWFVVQSKRTDPNILHTRGLGLFNQNQYSEARFLFDRVIEAYPETSTAQSASYYKAITFYKEGNFVRTIEEFNKLIKKYPESHWVPEAYYHMGLSYARLFRIKDAENVFRTVIRDFPATPWAVHSRHRLAELPGER